MLNNLKYRVHCLRFQVGNSLLTFPLYLKLKQTYLILYNNFKLFTNIMQLNQKNIKEMTLQSAYFFFFNQKYNLLKTFIYLLKKQIIIRCQQ
jgi:hypothetical protein